MKPNISHSKLLELLEYNPKTGDFIWKKYRCQLARKGDIAGTIKENGYRYIRIGNKSYRANRLAWFYIKGYFPENEVDHKDRIRDNNKWENLEEKTAQCNARNRGVRIDSKSGIPGVIFNKQNLKWQAAITHSPKKRAHLGFYKSLKAAVINRWIGEVHFKFPNCQTCSPAYLYLKKEGLLWQ